uniref:Protein kinase domain-containing protein n=1 Tax=Tetraselmis chuii TaxID=63592 RepID=A0A7S1SMM9_9CHLO|mmetsp:Transcript_20078/g.35778  ORF Transcript_20078/g.35778 Transcript_20078/m.35778 type:complete len:453 (+) Transcript_20078:347-1705(+)
MRWLCCCGRGGFRKGFLREELDDSDWANLENHPARGRYQVSRQLGEGAFSQVLAARHNETRLDVALKIIFRNRPGLKTAHWEVLRNEVRALEECAHPNIVTMMDHYENSDQIVMVLELLKGGELLEHIQEIKKYTERKAAQLFVQILRAVAHMHSKGYIHRDVKPENVLFVNKPSTDEDSPCVVKLIDLGMATIYNPQKPIRQAMGTAGFLSPECCHKVPHTPAMDMWSLGVMLFVMLCGRMPYSHSQIENLQYPEIDIRRSPGTRSSSFKSLSTPAKQLLLGLLERNPRDRATAQQVLLHPWIAHHCGVEELVPAEAPAVQPTPSYASDGQSFATAASAADWQGSSGSDDSVLGGEVGTSGRSPRADSELAGGEVSGNQGFRGPIRVAKQDVVGSLQEMVAVTAKKLSGRDVDLLAPSFELTVTDSFSNRSSVDKAGSTADESLLLKDNVQ